MTTSDVLTIDRSFTQGEIPDPLTVTLSDADGNPIDLTGYTAAKFVYRNTNDGHDAAVTRDATIDGDQTANRGQVTYDWVAADLERPGLYEAEMWATNGADRPASQLIRYKIRRAVGTGSPF